MYKIAITMRQKEDNRTFFIKASYYHFLKFYFLIEVVLPGDQIHYEEIVKRNDALLICGGDDVHPSYYHQHQHHQTVIEKPPIEAMDFCLLSLFYKAHKPIFGICRGIQVINVFFRGTLYQDINCQYPTTVNHLKDAHYVYTTHFLKSYFPSSLKVNSYHHQCIQELSPLLQINAMSEDGIIEGVESHYILAVQWHPELMNQEHQKRFIQMMIDFIKKTSLL